MGRWVDKQRQNKDMEPKHGVLILGLSRNVKSAKRKIE